MDGDWNNVTRAIKNLAGTLTWEQSLRWSVFLVTLFFVAILSTEHYRFANYRLNWIYLSILYALPLAMFAAIFKAPYSKMRYFGVLIAGVLIPISVLFLNWSVSNACSLWPVGERYRDQVLLSEGRASTLLYSSTGLQTNTGIKVILERPVLGGILLERKILLEVFSAFGSDLVATKDGKWLHFVGAVQDGLAGRCSTIVRNYDAAWDGVGNPRTTEFVIPLSLVRKGRR